MLGKPLAADAIEGGEGAEAFGDNGIGSGGRARLDRGDHQVFCGVLRGDKLEDFGAVAGVFEELGAKGVGNELGLTFLEYPVAEGVGEDGRGSELGAELFLAAGGYDEEAGAGGETAGEGVVGRGVASVKRDEDVAFTGAERGIGDRAGGEREAVGELVLAREAVAEVDELGAELEAADKGAGPEEMGEGEREVAFAGAGVDDAEEGWRGLRVEGWESRIRRRGVGEGFGEEVLEELGEFLDLPEFVGHAFAGLAAVIGDAQGAEPGGVGGDEVGFFAVVRGRRGARERRRDVGDFQAGGAVGVGFELSGLRGGEEMCVEEIAAEERREESERFGWDVVFRDVAGVVAVEKRQVRAGFEGDGADEEVTERRVGAAGFAEGELHEGAVAERGAEQVEEAVASGR